MEVSYVVFRQALQSAAKCLCGAGKFVAVIICIPFKFSQQSRSQRGQEKHERSEKRRQEQQPHVGKRLGKAEGLIEQGPAEDL